MNSDPSIKKLLSRIESVHLEHKDANASIEEIAQTVCAFLNSGGGTLLIEAAHTAQKASDRVRDIERDLRSLIKPGAFWSIACEPVGEVYYCILDVPAGRDRPFAVGGNIYLREGATSVLASSEQIQSIVESNYREVERWERQALAEADLDRFDADLIFETAELGSKRRDFPFSNPADAISVLRDLALWRRNTFTNGAEILFGARPAIQFPQIRVRVVVYAAHKGSDFITNKIFEGPILRTLRDVLAVVRQHTPVESLFRGGLSRVDRPAYPEEAVREGLVNALVHRDYAEFSGGVSVDIYPDRLVIWNSGRLPQGLKIPDLKHEHPSMPRNPDIAQVFWLRGEMERVGRGTQNIVAWCRDAALPDPVWTTGDNGVTLSFSSAFQSDDPRLNARQKKLLKDLKTGNSIRLPDYSENYIVSERQGRRDLAYLVQAGFLNREGDGPATLFVRLDRPYPAKPGQG